MTFSSPFFLSLFSSHFSFLSFSPSFFLSPSLPFPPTIYHYHLKSFVLTSVKHHIPSHPFHSMHANPEGLPYLPPTPEPTFGALQSCPICLHPLGFSSSLFLSAEPSPPVPFELPLMPADPARLIVHPG